MSKFECLVTTVVQVDKHPNADRLEILRLDNMDYNLISGNGNYKVGDKVAYIPEGSILTDEILEHLEMKDNSSLKKLEGKRCIVKTIRLRGVVSEGLLLRLPDWSVIGSDVAGLAGITKYVPRQPSNFSGRTRPVGDFYGKIPLWDLDALQKKVDTFEHGEQVFITEKLHGTQINCGGFVDDDGTIKLYVTSKGRAENGVTLDYEHDSNANNIYVKTFNEQLKQVILDELEDGSDVTGVSICGEIVGPGVQDLTYGLTAPTLFVYAVRVRRTGERYVHASGDLLVNFCSHHGLRTVPVISHSTSFDYEMIKGLAEEKETVSGRQLHTMEGVVVSSLIGDKYKKYVGNNYKLRGGNTTELE